MRKHHCLNCGKSGFFLPLNDAMLCKECAKAQAEVARKAQEELILKQQEEAELKRLQEEKEFNAAVDYYHSIRQAYSNTRPFLPDYVLGLTGLTIYELRENQKPYLFLIENLPKWSQYRFFYEIFVKDFEKDPSIFSYEKHRYFRIGMFKSGEPLNISKEFDKIMSHCQKAVGIYEKAIQDLQRAANSILLDIDKQVDINSLCLGQETHHVAGMKYYEKNLMKLASASPYYPFTKSVLIDYGMIDKEVWKNEFRFCQAELIPEPDNPHDPNAIKVVVNGEHIGYIKADDCVHVLNLINTHRICRMTCEISGGAYKRVNEHYSIERDKETYFLERGTKPFEATISIVTVKSK